jgi:hypothetical protein
MLKLTLDGREMESGTYNDLTLSQMIDGLEKELAPERVIVAMSLNGQPLNRGDEKNNAAKPVKELDSLVIDTQHVGALAVNTLHTLIEYFPQLKAHVEESIRLLQSEKESEGHLALGSLIEGLQMVSSAWHGISRFLEVEGRSPQEVMPKMNGFNGLLKDLLTAQQNTDIVQICDLLEFELITILDQWETHASSLIEDTVNQG